MTGWDSASSRGRRRWRSNSAVMSPALQDRMVASIGVLDEDVGLDCDYLSMPLENKVTSEPRNRRPSTVYVFRNMVGRGGLNRRGRDKRHHGRRASSGKRIKSLGVLKLRPATCRIALIWRMPSAPRFFVRRWRLFLQRSRRFPLSAPLGCRMGLRQNALAVCESAPG